MGKPTSDMSWGDVLLLAANAQVDATENARLEVLLASFPPGSPERQHFANDLQVAKTSIQRLASQNIALTWGDGRTIIANGAEVHAFQSTTAQFVDSTLFNTSSQWSQGGSNHWADDKGIVPEAWTQQFGEKNAAIYLREIAGVSSSQSELDDLVQRVSTVLGGGISDVAWDLDAALALTGAPAVLRALLAKRLATVGAEASGGLSLLRQAYVNEVKALDEVALSMRAAGASPEQVARQLHQIRRDLGVQYKDLTPTPQLEVIYARNLEKYGDKLGPTVDWLRANGKSWEQIVESASRSGGKDLGF